MHDSFMTYIRIQNSYTCPTHKANILIQALLVHDLNEHEGMICMTTLIYETNKTYIYELLAW